MPTLGEILANKIGSEGKSKAYVANELHVSEKTIENYINGKRFPKQAALIKLSNLLDFSLSDLSAGNENIEQNVPGGKLKSIPNGHNEPSEKQKDHRLDDLIKSNLNNSESVLISNRNEERLIRMLESRSDSEKEKNLENLENYAGLIDVIRAIGLKCGYWKNDDTADEELRRFVALHKV